MLDSLDAVAVRRWCAAGLDGLRRHQREIDELNVYPVPDGDTGTNLVLTLASAQRALESGQVGHQPGSADAGETVHAALRLMARGALYGARGNSGVIVSQILRGLADGLDGTPVVRGAAFAAALRAAANAAYAAVADPAEGTILSVAIASAEAAESTASDELSTVVRAAADAAKKALARTPRQLDVLARAGVVDAGGRGLVVLLDALCEVITGDPVAPSPALMPARRPLEARRETGSAEFQYEVQYLLDATGEAVDQLRAVLRGLGDSLVVVGDADPAEDRATDLANGSATDPANSATAGLADGATANQPALPVVESPADSAGQPAAEPVRTWHVHVHVNDVGAAIEAAVRVGRPYQISVTRFADHVPELAGSIVDHDARGAVVVTPGPELAALFAAEGVVSVNAPPSTMDIVAAVRSTGAGHVVVLPSDPNSRAVANAAAAEAAAAGLVVRVIPTKSVVQALAALAVRDAVRPFEDDVIAMAEAAGACRYAEVTTARREALTVAGRCRPGDVLALVDGEVNLIGTDLRQTSIELLDRLLSTGGELVTVVVGAGAPAGLADALTQHIAKAWPFVEIQVYQGGQPDYPLLIGVE